MKNDKVIDAEITEEKSLTVQEPQNLDKPKKDTEFAQEAAKFLVDIIKQNNWAKKLGGQSEHIQYEGWQTAGKYYGLSVKTFDAEYVELGGIWGFKAKAVVVNESTGVEVGSAEAYCMSDEPNWSRKPKFQLASMAQTRAGSKALRQILGFVVALAGYNPTPAEEMEGVHAGNIGNTQHTNANVSSKPAVRHENGLTYEPVEETVAVAMCPSCHAPAGKPHASKCTYATPVEEKSLICEVCGQLAKERKGISKSGKQWHGVFCSTEDRTHTRWLWN